MNDAGGKGGYYQFLEESRHDKLGDGEGANGSCGAVAISLETRKDTVGESPGARERASGGRVVGKQTAHPRPDADSWRRRMFPPQPPLLSNPGKMQANQAGAPGLGERAGSLCSTVRNGFLSLREQEAFVCREEGEPGRTERSPQGHMF